MSPEADRQFARLGTSYGADLRQRSAFMATTALLRDWAHIHCGPIPEAVKSTCGLRPVLLIAGDGRRADVGHLAYKSCRGERLNGVVHRDTGAAFDLGQETIVDVLNREIEGVTDCG